jgi:outer membrane receptor protein involved in Fe transport
MNLQRFAVRATTAAVSLAFLHGAPVLAQEAPAADAQPTAAAAPPPAAATPAAASGPKVADASDALGLDAIVVTGTSEGISKMRSSVSISTMDADQIQEVQATSVTDLLRSIPGVHAEASSGESNANLTVRGIPISAGGSRYVQWQEDGLPLLQIGDLDFLTPDTYLRTDSVTGRVEVVRGGSASTLATNAPGGIINFISKTGEEAENVIGVTEALNYRETRYDFGKGGSLGPKTHYYLGGFYRDGNGPRDGGVQLENGGQLRANITQDLDNGYVRLSFKELDDHTPTYLPIPVSTVGGHIQALPGIDPRTASLYSPYLLPDVALTGANGHAVSNVDNGLSATSTALGAEAGLDIGRGWKLDEKFRYANNGGHFLGVYDGGAGGAAGVAAAPAGTTYLTGPNAGKPYTGNAFTAVVFNTNIDDASLTANDLKLGKTFDLGGGNNVVANGGLYTSSQRVAMTWNFNQYLMQATGDKPAILSSSINGTPGFGGCCERVIDATYRMTSPYLNLTAQQGPINVDASVRHDEQTASGYYAEPTSTGGNYNLGDLNVAGKSGTIDYSVGHTSYSIGGNLRLVESASLFARYSDGVSFNGDRLAWGNPIDGSTPIPLNEVKQTEAGAKLRAGSASLFITFFQARTGESNYDLTTQQTTANHYLANGVEFEGGYILGNLRLNGGLTLTNATITSGLPGTPIGSTPDRLAHALYQFAAVYEGGALKGGLNLAGTSSSWNNNNQLPGYTIVNAFVQYAIVSSTTLTLGVNNLLNTIAYTESDGPGDARALNGRTIKAGLTYRF